MEKPTAMEPSQEQWVSATKVFLHGLGVSRPIPFSEHSLEKKDAFGDLLRSLLKVDRIEPGRISCNFTVSPAFANAYNTLHGGAVAAISEAVALACARSVAGDKDIFLGECAISYLSAAKLKDEVQVDGVVIRHGKSVIVTSVEFRIKETGKLIYSTRATFYGIPISNL